MRKIHLVIDQIRFDYGNREFLWVSAEGTDETGMKFSLTVRVQVPTKLHVGDSIWITVENISELAPLAV